MTDTATTPVEYGIYSPASVAIWRSIATRQVVRDSVYWRALARYLKPGSVLELGSACGQVSKLLSTIGFQTVGSDYFQFFVDDMRANGIEAYRIDATRISDSEIGDRKFDNVIAQSLSPQLRKSKDITDAVYASVHATLKPGGRFLFTGALYPWWPKKAAMYYSFDEHLAVINAQRGFRLVTAFGYQWLPTSLYRDWNKHILHFVDFHCVKIKPIRGVFVLERV